MAKYRPLYTKVWKDNTFLDYTPEQKLLFIYLCTNDSVTDSGIYPISFRTINYETGLPTEQIPGILSEMRNVYYDKTTNYVFIKNFHKYNRGGKPELLRKAILFDYQLSKHCPLWNIFKQTYPDFIEIQPLANGLPTVSQQLPNGLPTVTEPLKQPQPLPNGLPTVSQPLSNGLPTVPITHETSEISQPLANGLPTVSQRYPTKVTIVKESKVTKLNKIKEINKEKENVYEVFVKYFGEPSSFQAEEIKDIAITYPTGWFTEACEIMARNNVSSLKYATTIMERWFTEGKNNGHKDDNKPKDRPGW